MIGALLVKFIMHYPAMKYKR